MDLKNVTKINVLPVKQRKKEIVKEVAKVVEVKKEKVKVERGPEMEVRHTCECVCLKNIPGHPYRIGYAMRYLDSQNKPRCSHCDCLALDYESV